MTSELESVLRQATDEIRGLRRTNEVLRAKVEVMDLFACVLHTRPVSVTQGNIEDVAWKIDKILAEMSDLQGRGKTDG